MKRQSVKSINMKLKQETINLNVFSSSNAHCLLCACHKLIFPQTFLKRTCIYIVYMVCVVDVYGLCLYRYVNKW